MRVGLITAAIVAVADQITKYIVFVGIQPPPYGGLDVTSFLSLVSVMNRGVSFGLFSSGSPWAPFILTAIAATVVAALTFWLRQAETRMLSISLGMLIGGAIGNAIDRLVHGAVMDFVNLHWEGYHWPAFNVADAAITVGAVLMVLDALFVRKK
nr:signal peptidase II [Roseospira visakhapatnamensis]